MFLCKWLFKSVPHGRSGLGLNTIIVLFLYILWLIMAPPNKNL